MRRYAVLTIPIILGIAATLTDYLPFKMGVPLVCALIVLGIYLWQRPQRSDLFWLVAAFVFSAIGDYFLSNKEGQASYFVIGIGLYFLAHIGYLTFALRNGRISWPALVILLIGYLPYYFLALNPAIADGVLATAVLLYLLISCVALAAAFGLRRTGLVKGLYVIGIFFILFSDTIISFNEFLQYTALNGLILPTYYLAHITISATALRRAEENRAA